MNITKYHVFKFISLNVSQTNEQAQIDYMATWNVSSGQKRLTVACIVFDREER